MPNFAKGFIYLLIFSCIGLQISIASTCDQGSGTDVFGPIWQDTTWTKGNSPYCITQNITVLENITFTIEPGVIIKFWEGTDQKLDDKFSIIIDGELIARGTQGERIIITSSRNNPEPGDWDYIEFTGNSKAAIYNEYNEYLEGSILEYVTIEYGGGNYRAAVTEKKAPYFNYVTFQWNLHAAIDSGDEFTKIANCSFFKNTNHNSRGDAIYSQNNKSLQISDSTFIENGTQNNDGASTVSAYGPLSISNSKFMNNLGGAVLSRGLLNIESSTFLNNDGIGVRAVISKIEVSHEIVQDSVIQSSVFTGNTSDRGIIYIPYGEVRISKCLIYDNQTPETINLNGPVVINESSIINNSGTGLYKWGVKSLTIQNSNVFGNQFYDVYNNSGIDIIAKSNYWGTDDPAEIFINIYDKFDDPYKGEVDFGVRDNSYLTSYASNAPRIPKTPMPWTPMTAMPWIPLLLLGY